MKANEVKVGMMVRVNNEQVCIDEIEGNLAYCLTEDGGEVATEIGNLEPVFNP